MGDFLRFFKSPGIVGCTAYQLTHTLNNKGEKYWIIPFCNEKLTLCVNPLDSQKSVTQRPFIANINFPVDSPLIRFSFGSRVRALAHNLEQEGWGGDDELVRVNRAFTQRTKKTLLKRMV